MDSAWIKDVCLAWEGNDPSELLENLMAHEQCPAFGPVHHALVGAALLACARAGERDAAKHDVLTAELDELGQRAACVPGAACAKWGVCGAAASCGMAFAILAGNAPLRLPIFCSISPGRAHLGAANATRGSRFARRSRGSTGSWERGLS